MRPRAPQLTAIQGRSSGGAPDAYVLTASTAAWVRSPRTLSRSARGWRQQDARWGLHEKAWRGPLQRVRDGVASWSLEDMSPRQLAAFFAALFVVDLLVTLPALIHLLGDDGPLAKYDDVDREGSRGSEAADRLTDNAPVHFLAAPVKASVVQHGGSANSGLDTQPLTTPPWVQLIQCHGGVGARGQKGRYAGRWVVRDLRRPHQPRRQSVAPDSENDSSHAALHVVSVVVAVRDMVPVGGVGVSQRDAVTNHLVRLLRALCELQFTNLPATAASDSTVGRSAKGNRPLAIIASVVVVVMSSGPEAERLEKEVQHLLADHCTPHLRSSEAPFVTLITPKGESRLEWLRSPHPQLHRADDATSDASKASLQPETQPTLTLSSAYNAGARHIHPKATHVIFLDAAHGTIFRTVEPNATLKLSSDSATVGAFVASLLQPMYQRPRRSDGDHDGSLVSGIVGCVQIQSTGQPDPSGSAPAAMKALTGVVGMTIAPHLNLSWEGSDERGQLTFGVRPELRTLTEPASSPLIVPVQLVGPHCLAVESRLVKRLGGFTEELPLAASEAEIGVDFSVRAWLAENTLLQRWESHGVGRSNWPAYPGGDVSPESLNEEGHLYRLRFRRWQYMMLQRSKRLRSRVDGSAQYPVDVVASHDAALSSSLSLRPETALQESRLLRSYPTRLVKATGSLEWRGVSSLLGCQLAPSDGAPSRCQAIGFAVATFGALWKVHREAAPENVAGPLSGATHMRLSDFLNVEFAGRGLLVQTVPAEIEQADRTVANAPQPQRSPWGQLRRSLSRLTPRNLARLYMEHQRHHVEGIHDRDTVIDAHTEGRLSSSPAAPKQETVATSHKDFVLLTSFLTSGERPKWSRLRLFVVELPVTPCADPAGSLPSLSSRFIMHYHVDCGDCHRDQTHSHRRVFSDSTAAFFQTEQSNSGSPERSEPEIVTSPPLLRCDMPVIVARVDASRIHKLAADELCLTTVGDVRTVQEPPLLLQLVTALSACAANLVTPRPPTLVAWLGGDLHPHLENSVPANVVRNVAREGPQVDNGTTCVRVSEWWVSEAATAVALVNHGIAGRRRLGCVVGAPTNVTTEAAEKLHQSDVYVAGELCGTRSRGSAEGGLWAWAADRLDSLHLKMFGSDSRSR